MPYIWFNSVLEALGKRLNFESISNMYGRTVFDKKGGDAINKAIAHANPMFKENVHNSAAAFLNMPGTFATIDLNHKDEAKDVTGDISWFEEYMK